MCANIAINAFGINRHWTYIECCTLVRMLGVRNRAAIKYFVVPLNWSAMNAITAERNHTNVIFAQIDTHKRAIYRRTCIRIRTPSLCARCVIRRTVNRVCNTPYSCNIYV